MDQRSPSRTDTETLAARSAAAVQALRTRAQGVLEERQQRLTELEERITAQLERISPELSQETTVAPSAASAEMESLEELRREIDRERIEWEKLRQQQEAANSAELRELRPKFDLALEDVRRLRERVAELEQELAAARHSPAAAGVESVASDWETQKRLLLASLDGEDATTPERKQERASIKDTIRITDEVVSEKDREIEVLQQQLEELAGKTNDDRILNADEVIRAERERLAALEVELNEKLRAAELELSVGRAKITRQQSELEQQRIELEALKHSGASGSSSHGPPKRRWLSKLGLGGDDDG